MRTSGVRRGFSLLELVIVIVIIGIIAAIAIPRMSRGAQRAAENALRANLQSLRNALELYAADRNGTFPVLASFEAGLTGESTFNGVTYGPYLQIIPDLPVETPATDKNLVADGGSITLTGGALPAQAGGGSGAWYYNPAWPRRLYANSTDAQYRAW